MKMEGMFLQSVPIVGSLVVGGLLLATVLGAVAYEWLCQGPRPTVQKRQPLQKTA